MKEKIDRFLEYFTNITKEESDTIRRILAWDGETKMAFMIAKQIFEEKEDESVTPPS